VKAASRERLREAWRRLRGGELTPGRAAASVAVGIAIGVLPLWGVHWALVLAVCLPLRLDASVAYLASNVSLPFFAPFITFAEIAIGSRVLRGAWPTIAPEQVKQIALGTVLGELALGTAIVAAGGAATGGALAYVATALVRRRRQ
jgi:uncharacterized protein (DUF2062 family)